MGRLMLLIRLLPFMACLRASKVSTEFAHDFQSRAASFLQLGLEVDVDARSTDSEVQKLASLLARARKECLKATEECLPVLSELRLAVWPHVQVEANCSSLAWMPGWHLDTLTASPAVGVYGSRAMFFLHVYKGAGMEIYANLQQITTDFRRMRYPDLCQKFHVTDPQERRAFTFVRDPISRFISGYGEIEYRSRTGEDWPSYKSLAELLKRYPVGSSERAAAFFEEFLRNGIENNGLLLVV
eukprot:s1627_g1.t1